MVMSWQAQISKHLSMHQGSGTPTTGIMVFTPHIPCSLLGMRGSVVLALLHVVDTCFVGCCPVAVGQAMGQNNITPYAPSRCCTVFFHCLAVPEGLSELPAMRQAELGQTTWSLHMGWQGSLPKAMTGAKLDVSICPRFLCGRSPWCLTGGE